ncbi:MAG: AAA family ATPase [Candidatus Pacebacteria bacterium]|nr:AAA family ATPase [Candidatus Paceibacterota bacterium]
MKILSVSVTGYKSVQEETVLFLRDNLTCFIGANEHGKTNLLNAIHKIGEQKLDPADANSVLSNKGITELPKISYELKFEDTDKQQVKELLDEQLKVLEAAIPSTSPSPSPSPAPEDEEVEPESTTPDSNQSSPKQMIKQLLKDIGSGEVAIKLHIDTTSRKYSYKDIDNLSVISPELVAKLENLLPKAYLFAPSNQIADGVTPAELEDSKFVEFQGLIKLSSFWNKKAELFKDGSNSVGLRTQASRKLTEEVKKLWSQGKSDYNFIINLDSGPKLSLAIEDNTGNFDSPSSRSLGFRAFFSFYLAIYAYTSSVSPSGYIFLFDEPDIHLHPEAQKDLLRELRNLGKSNQIVFATHSPFMIDKNNLLSTVVIKKQTVQEQPKGTKVIHKPYLSNWLAVRETLGVMMSDTLLYAQKSLFVEGTSDRLFICAILDRFKDELNIDLNYLSLLDGDRKSEALGVARILLSEGRNLVALVDGDEGGEDLAKQYLKLAKDLSKEESVQTTNLKTVTGAKKPVSIEDMLPIDIFSSAVNKYIQEIHKKDPIADLDKELAKKEKTMTRGKAFVELVAAHLSVAEDKIAKTTVADFFGQLIAEKPEHPFPESAKKLATELKASLNLE